MINELVNSNRLTIKNGSKTFSFASCFFSKQQAIGAWNLYSWCRYVDDKIDTETQQDLIVSSLQEIRESTQNALSGGLVYDRPFLSLQHLHKDFSIEQQLPMDLIRGLEFDANKTRPQNEAELIDYCYCVAGTVGLMMCSVMSASSVQAHDYAKALGEAMQLTNICRDLYEDYLNDRCYIPSNWLKEFNLSEVELWNGRNDYILISIRERLLQMAQKKYDFAFDGLKYLSFRSAWAVVLAGFIYREIGAKAQKLKFVSLRKRTVISFMQKAIIAFSATAFLIAKRLKEGKV